MQTWGRSAIPIYTDRMGMGQKGKLRHRAGTLLELVGGIPLGTLRVPFWVVIALCRLT